MTKKYISYVALICQNDIADIDFFENYQDACDEFDRQLEQDQKMLLLEGVRPEDIKLDKDEDIAKLSWYLTPEVVRAKNPDITPQELELECAEHTSKYCLGFGELNLHK